MRRRRCRTGSYIQKWSAQVLERIFPLEIILELDIRFPIRTQYHALRYSFLLRSRFLSFHWVGCGLLAFLLYIAKEFVHASFVVPPAKTPLLGLMFTDLSWQNLGANLRT